MSFLRGRRIEILPGQYYDAESGLNYNWHRYYSSGNSGRYIESDPIGLKGGVNTYLYASANPILSIDSTGLWSWNISESVNGGISIAIPASPSGLGIGGKFGLTLRKCCTGKKTIANELYVNFGLGLSFGAVVAGSSAPGGNIEMINTGGLPKCLNDKKLISDLGPSIEFDAGKGWGLSGAISNDSGLVIGVGAASGAGLLALPAEGAALIMQTETGQPCSCEK